MNAVALVAMAVILRPGLPPTPAAQRVEYLRLHHSAWEVSWVLWLVTTVVLALFCVRLHRALGAGTRGRIAVGLVFAGLIPDLFAHVSFINDYPRMEIFDHLDRTTALLSGGLANGAYTVAWSLLAWRAPFPRAFFLVLAPGMAGGYLLAVAGLANWTTGLVAGSAAAIPCFAVWSFLVGCFYWKKARGAATMSPHA